MITPALQNTGVAQTTAASAPLPPRQMAQVKEKAQEFEAMFLSEMMGHMFSGLEVDETFGGGKGEEIFRSLMINEYSNNIAKSPKGIGLADHVQKAMIEMQSKMNAR